ncbi:RNA-binding S4 domain-containing protein [Methyloceanibacter sp.]|jgi:ribosome-associated heat shock protein Hsp15|uniref:RNA-binding S4 domain-containing protein n=1 Tax=Methyloceanibacter sp. TaxID=1965321 RepID=UPI002F817289
MKGSQDEHSDTETESTPAGTQRLDKWLWFARVIKSRTLAAQLVEDGKVRVNRVRASKPSQVVHSGDVLTIAVRGRVRLLRVLAAADRRGPPAEARMLYEVVLPGGGSDAG